MKGLNHDFGHYHIVLKLFRPVSTESFTLLGRSIHCINVRTPNTKVLGSNLGQCTVRKGYQTASSHCASQLRDPSAKEVDIDAFQFPKNGETENL